MAGPILFRSSMILPGLSAFNEFHAFARRGEIVRTLFPGATAWRPAALGAVAGSGGGGRHA
jgi:hypothetical protein